MEPQNYFRKTITIDIITLGKMISDILTIRIMQFDCADNS